MAAQLVIHGGTVVNPVTCREHVADVAIEGGIICAIGAVPESFRHARRIDATGLVVAPGLVDLSARLREPGYEYKATLEAYTHMVTQMKLNRGGNPTVLRLLRMKLEQLTKEIKTQEKTQ